MKIPVQTTLRTDYKSERAGHAGYFSYVPQGQHFINRSVLTCGQDMTTIKKVPHGTTLITVSRKVSSLAGLWIVGGLSLSVNSDFLTSAEIKMSLICTELSGLYPEKPFVFY